MPLNGPAPVTGGFSVAAIGLCSFRVFAHHDDGVGLVVVRGNHEVLRGGRALEDARGEVEARAVARAVVAARPARTHVRGRAHFLLEVRRAAEVRAYAHRDEVLGLDRAVDALDVL